MYDRIRDIADAVVQSAPIGPTSTAAAAVVQLTSVRDCSVDLAVDELEVFLYLSEPGGHADAVGLQEGKSFLLVAGPERRRPPWARRRGVSSP